MGLGEPRPGGENSAATPGTAAAVNGFAGAAVVVVADADGAVLGVGGQGEDWLGEAWWGLNDRYRDVLGRRLAGENLAHIGEVFGVSRGRVRQLQVSAEKHLVVAEARHASGFVDQLAVVVGNHPAISNAQVVVLVPTAVGPARYALLRAHGLTHPRTWFGELTAWWTQHPTALGVLLGELVALAPLTAEDLPMVAAAVGLPDALPLTELLGGAGSPLVEHSTGWVRRHHVTRDAAYLWLQAERKARTVTDIAAITGTAENTVRERMRRDDAFTQVRQEGTWALTQWQQPGTTTDDPTATDTVAGVLRDHGPKTLAELQAGSGTRAPVTLNATRVQQGPASDLIGCTANGRYHLVDHGNTALPDVKPPRPRHITATANGTFLSVVMTVDGDLLRGGGLRIDDWVTEYLRMRTPPAQRHFRWANTPGELVIHRYRSHTTITSLRTAVLTAGAVTGCTIALHLTTNPDQAAVHHHCPPHHCPGRRRRR